MADETNETRADEPTPAPPENFAENAPAPIDADSDAAPIPPTRKPWDQWDDESARMFSYFCAYRDMPKETRSVDAAYTIATGKVPEPRGRYGRRLAPGNWYTASSKYSWLARAQAFDTHRLQEKIRERERESENFERSLDDNRRTFRKNELVMAMKGFAKAAQILDLPLVTEDVTELKDGKTIVHKHATASPSLLFAASSLMNVSSRIGRQALGIQSGDENDITPEEFKESLFKADSEVEQHLPRGSIPPLPPQKDTKPAFHNHPHFSGKSRNESALVDEAINGNGGNYGNEIVPMKGERERP